MIFGMEHKQKSFDSLFWMGHTVIAKKKSALGWQTELWKNICVNMTVFWITLRHFLSHMTRVAIMLVFVVQITEVASNILRALSISNYALIQSLTNLLTMYV